MSNPVKKHHFAAFLALGATQLPGSFDKFEGGGLSLEVESYRPGGMVGTIVLPAPASVENITLERYVDAQRDVVLDPWIRGQIETATATVTVAVFGADKKPVGKPQVYTGRVGKYQGPQFDSNDDSGPAMMSFEITCEVPA